MERDFSQAALDKLLNLINEINQDQWFDWTDELGDWWYGTIFYSDNISDCMDDINGFHKRMLDKNDCSAGELRDIFNTVRQVDQNYATRFSAALLNLENYNRALQSLTKTFQPGNSTPADVKRILSNGFHSMETQMDILRKLSTDGLDKSSLAKQESSVLVDTLESVCRTLMEHAPSVGMDTNIEIPIGPGLVFYYKTGASFQGDGNTSVTINTVLENQRLALSGREYSAEFMGIAVSGSKDNDGNWAPGIAYIRPLTENTTITAKYELGFGSVSVEETVTTTINQGSISSTAGIRVSLDDNWNPVPVPVPVYVPTPSYEVPSFDPDWGTVAVIGVGALIVAGCIFFPEAAPVLLPALAF